MGWLQQLSINNAKKAGGEVWSQATKKPTQAVVESVQQKSLKPMQNYGSTVTGSIGAAVGGPSGMDAVNRAVADAKKRAEAQMSAPPAAPVTGGSSAPLKGFTFTSETPFDSQFAANYGNTIGANEDVGAAKGNIAAKYASLGELNKLKEGAQNRMEQNAISRRLAASGMMGSGAGMRMQQQAQAESGRRAAMGNLGLAAEQAQAEQGASEAATARNLQRENLRMGAAESAAQRGFAAEQFKAQKELQQASFERDNQTILENQKIARDIQRYNDRGLIGQLFGDLFGGGQGVSTKSIFGLPTGL